MYKLVIIDDEFEQVNGMRNFIEWNKHDIEVVDVAYTGKDGLDILKKHEPDIAIIDIQMPYMSGLEVIENANSLGLKTKMIILSGHDDFTFAQKAIKLNASNYLLKPCSAEDILQEVLKTKNIIENEVSKTNLFQKYQKSFNNYRLYLKEGLIKNLLDNKLRNPDTFIDEKVKYEINLNESKTILGIIRFDEIESIYGSHSNESFDYTVIGILDQLHKGLTNLNEYEIVFHYDDFVIITSDSISRSEFISLITNLYTDLQSSMEFSFSVGISGRVSSLLELHIAYNQALSAIEDAVFIGEKIGIYKSDMIESHYEYFYSFSLERDLFSLIENINKNDIEKSVNMFLEGHQTDNQQFIKKITLNLIANLHKFCASKNLDSDDITSFSSRCFDKILESTSLEEIRDTIISLFDYIITGIGEYENVNVLIQKAIKLIAERYSQNLNLKTIAEELQISPAYLSVLFKKETVQNFVDYLNNFRIERAKELLKDVTLKNYEIAYKVGFQDEKYFFKLFKKYTGLTASQYRDSISIVTKRAKS